MSQPFLLDHLSAKQLGELAMPDFCPKCYWMKARMKFQGPWSSFPSIFSHIDSYSKAITQAHMAAFNGAPPPWLMKFGKLSEQIVSPHWSKFSFQDPATGVVLRGSPDEMFRLEDNTIAILDYKTARFTEHQDNLLPIYKVQLGVYRWLALKNTAAFPAGLGQTSVTGLLYYEPATHGATADMLRLDGFVMPFTANILPIQTDLAQVESLLVEAKRLVQLPEPPTGRAGCKNCQIIDHMKQLVA